MSRRSCARSRVAEVLYTLMTFRIMLCGTSTFLTTSRQKSVRTNCRRRPFLLNFNFAFFVYFCDNVATNVRAPTRLPQCSWIFMCRALFLSPRLFFFVFFLVNLCKKNVIKVRVVFYSFCMFSRDVSCVATFALLSSPAFGHFTHGGRQHDKTTQDLSTYHRAMCRGSLHRRRHIAARARSRGAIHTNDA